ncbi:protein of unknown function [Methylocaldum szegediense]|uniref:Uncharacterized protein n=1 Tax=Methylocaldum szegediense TaxID=73780 RepID=A0ABM9I1C1_9GAMM|nr:protein of unknown function [Methylocaldum szegediense]
MITQGQALYGLRPQVQHNFAVLNILSRHDNSVRVGVNEQIGRALVVDYPVVYGPYQVRFE